MRRSITKIDVAEERMEIVEAKKRFMKHCIVKNLAAYTIERYENGLDAWDKFMEIYDIQYLDQVNIDVIEDFIIYCKNKGTLKDVSINTYLSKLRAFLYFCMERGYMKNKFKIKMLKEDRTFKEPYTDDELQKLLRRPNSNNWCEWRNWAMINYLIATGNRAATIVAIKIKHVDFEQKLIRLEHTKNRKQQIIPISVSLEKALKMYLKLHDWTEEDYLFTNERNEQLEVHAMREALRRYNIKRGVTKTGLHLYRHTFAKMYILGGGGVLQLQKLLGHSTLEMTMRYVNLYSVDILVDNDKYNPLNKLVR